MKQHRRTEVTTSLYFSLLDFGNLDLFADNEPIHAKKGNATNLSITHTTLIMPV